MFLISVRQISLSSQLERKEWASLMKTFTYTLVLSALLAFSSSSVFSDDLEQLAGKWSVKRTNDQGQTSTQVIEIKKDTFKFRVLGGDNSLRLYATGKVKLEKFGPFSGIQFYEIKAGQTESDLEPVEDSRTGIYVLESDSWSLATNFDRVRDNQKPRVDTYTKGEK